MFDKLKKFVENLSKGYEYVCDVETIFTYMQKEFAFSLEEQLESVTDFYLYYKGVKHTISIFNYAFSNTDTEKGLIINLDDIEFHSLNDFMKNAKLDDTLLADIKGYLKIELIYSDSTYLNEYKANHPDVTPDF